MRRESLCDRLTLAVVIAVALGLACFSLLSLLAIDRTLRTALDARLATTERLVVATSSGKPVDSHLKQRLLAILGVQQNGAVIAGDDRLVFASTGLPTAVRRAARAADPVSPFVQTIVNGTPVRLIVTPLTLAGSIGASAILWRPLDLMDDYERSAELIFSLSSFFIVVVTGIAGRRLIRRALDPLRSMAAAASDIEAHDLSLRLSSAGWDAELHAFATTFDRVLERLEAAFRRQRQFTADASHDLRAPLAVMRAEVELALARRTAGPDRTTLLSLADEIGDLDHLIDSLLAVARADDELIPLRALDIASALAGATKRIAVLARAHGVQIDRTVVHACVFAEAETLDRILLAILHNAVTFSPPGGTIWIETQPRDGAIEVSIRDEGPGFSAAARQFGCDRFWRGDTARGRGGSGLGLAIAQASVRRLSGAMTLDNAATGGARVSIVLPCMVP